MIAGTYAETDRADCSLPIGHLPSDGQISRIELADFLSRGYGPEQQSLLQLIGTLMDETQASLLAVKAIQLFR